MGNSTFSSMLRTVVGLLEIPVVVVLLLLMALTVILTASIIMEYFTERRLMTEKIPKFVEAMDGKTLDEESEMIRDSGLLIRQKRALQELIDNCDMPEDARVSLSKQLIYEEEVRYKRIVEVTDVIVRISPMFGLLGTLIPLGPGLIALSRGDTATLSASLMTAFDTTAAGLVVAAINFIISVLRKRWYDGYITGFETIMETLLAQMKQMKEDRKC